MKTVAVIVNLFVAMVWYVLCWPFINLYRGVATIFKKLFATAKPVPVPVSNANTIAPTKRYKKLKSKTLRWVFKRKNNLQAKRREARQQRRFNLENEF